MGKRIIIAGGGTGGHIFPAVAIANAIRRLAPDTTFLFIGAKGKMEMEKVPEAGYNIEGLDIAGFNRSSLVKNLGLPLKLIRSFLQVKRIFKSFVPDAAIGVGGYSTYPVLRYAQSRNIPTFIHESNSFAGKSNSLLGKKATYIFTASDNMEKFFPADRLMRTGNPVRALVVANKLSRKEGLEFFGLQPEYTTVLVTGGSLGAKSINDAIDAGVPALLKANLQLIWQTGKADAERGAAHAVETQKIWSSPFITRMEYAYAAADIVVSRSGSVLYELCAVKKPVIFIPYPFAAEDHQTANAKNLVDKHAAQMIPDAQAGEKLVPAIIALASDKTEQQILTDNISKGAITDADDRIARKILKTING